jgi:hypothetical protein
VVCMTTCEVNRRQTKCLLAFSALFLLKVDSCGFHLNSLLLVVHDLVPYGFNCLLFALDHFTLCLQLELHKLLEYTELEILLFC